MRFSNYRALLSTSAVAAVLLGAMPAAAQDQQQSEQPQQAPEASSEDIVVTGIRSSLQGALNAKRNAAQVLDAISAEDIGKFPDKNVGEALQRVTGVQLTRSDGEGSGITIRGADPSLNRVEINGVTALSTTVGGGRDVDFRDLPSEFVNRLEVVKSATADMTEGGVGGTVRVITRRPFDNGGKPYLAGSAQAIYADIGDHMDPRLALIGSDTFANGTIGVLVSGTFENRNVESHQARTTGWVQLDSDPNTAGMQAYDLNNDGVGDFFPDIPRYVINRLETRRYALNGILEWRPSDDFKAYVESNWTKSIQSVTSQYLQTGTSGGIVDTENTIIGPDNTVEYLVMTNNTSKAQTSQLGVSYRNILGDIKRTTYNVALGADWTTGNLTLTPKISLSKAKAYNNEINATAAVTGMSSLIVDYSNGQNAPNIILPNDPTTTAGINQLTVLRRPRYDDQTEKMAKLDAEYKTDGGLFTSFKIGGQYRDLTVKSRFYTRTTTLNGFSDPAVREKLEGWGIETMACDLLDRSALEALPRADIPGRAPSAFFSLLKPHSRIPAHSGVTNTRAIIHLPLIVPPGCYFRVGGETRAWEEGQAFAFDDTIEHEAWNDSAHLRVVLIFDMWNPHLSLAEQQLLKQFYATADASRAQDALGAGV